MGLNVDLVTMLGAPKSVRCPSCKKNRRQCFDDYDIDDEWGKPLNKWKLTGWCITCDKSFAVRIHVQAAFSVPDVAEDP